MNLYELNPHIRYAKIHTQSFRLRKEISICYDCRVFFFENASGNITINGEKHCVEHQTAIFLPPLQKYRFNIDFTPETKIVILDFDLSCEFSHIKSSIGTANLQNFDPTLAPDYELPPELSKPIVKTLPKISTLLSQCADNFMTKNTFFRERSSALLKLCLLEFADTNNIHTALCAQILDYAHKNFADATLTNEKIAKSFNYHPNHINRIVKKETGKSLKSYLIYYRLQIAKDQLLTTRFSVSEIAFQTGFCSSAYFIKIFKEKNGITPKEYRRLRLHTEI